MSMYRKKEDISKHLPRAFYLFGFETDLKAIQFSYFLSVIKALTTQNKDKMSMVDVRNILLLRYALMFAFKNHFWNAQAS